MMTTPPALRPEWIPNAYKEEAPAIGIKTKVNVPQLSSAKKTLLKRRIKLLYKKP